MGVRRVSRSLYYEGRPRLSCLDYAYLYGYGAYVSRLDLNERGRLKMQHIIALV